MKQRWIAWVGALALAGCSAPPPPPPQTVATVHKSLPPAQLKALEDQQTLASYDGYGVVHFGMDEDAFRNAWPTDLIGAVDPAGSCSLLQPIWNKQLADFDFMFDQGRFVRYDVGTAQPIAPGGGRVGMSVAQIRALYGASLQVQPSNYKPNEQLLRVADGKGHVLIFETDETGKVSRWRVGVPPQIDNEDRCL
jgi:hypothetical protein